MDKTTTNRIKSRHVKCFVEIVRNGSLIKAAHALAITQSATSKTLNELEDILGERLLIRNRSGIYMTPAGEIFNRYASASLTALAQGVHMIEQTRKEARTAVLVGVLPNSAAEIMPTAISYFKKQYPQTRIKIETGNNARLLDLLRLGNVDFVLGRLAQPKKMMGLHFERLYEERIMCVAKPSHELLRETPSSLKAILDYPVILPIPDTVIRPEIDRFIISQGISSITDFIETISPDFARNYVINSDAIWLVPYGVVASELRTGILFELPFDLSSTASPVGISTRSEPGLSIESKILIKAVKDACKFLGRT